MCTIRLTKVTSRNIIAAERQRSLVDEARDALGDLDRLPTRGREVEALESCGGHHDPVERGPRSQGRLFGVRLVGGLTVLGVVTLLGVVGVLGVIAFLGVGLVVLLEIGHGLDVGGEHLDGDQDRQGEGKGQRGDAELGALALHLLAEEQGQDRRDRRQHRDQPCVVRDHENRSS
jgi:hypothetical protein